MDKEENMSEVIGKRMLGVESEGIEGKEMKEKIGVIVEENGNELIKIKWREDIMRRIVEIVGRNEVKEDIVDDIIEKIEIGELEKEKKRKIEEELIERGDKELGNEIEINDEEENVEKNELERRIGGDDIERRSKIIIGREEEKIEEVGRLWEIEIDDVNSRNGKEGEIENEEDIEIEGEIGKVIFGGLDLIRILLSKVEKLKNVRVKEKGVVVERKIGIEKEKEKVSNEDKRIDLEEDNVIIGERIVKDREKIKEVIEG